MNLEAQIENVKENLVWLRKLLEQSRNNGFDCSNIVDRIMFYEQWLWDNDPAQKSISGIVRKM